MQKKKKDFTKQLDDKILLSIFSYLMELPSMLPLSAGEPGLTLLVVCRRWRQVIFDTPPKWANIVVSPAVSSDSFSAHVKFNMCWLKLDVRRHSGHWLYISLLHDHTVPLPQQNTNTTIQTSGVEMDMLENIIFPAARRTKCLSLPFCSNHVAESFLTSPPCQFYFLESIEMRFLECDQPETGVRSGSEASLTNFSKPITVFQNSPFLRHTSIIINNGMNPLTLLLPWYQLTTINMGFTTIPPKVFITVLTRSSPSLCTGFFTVKFSSKPWKQNQRSTKILAPALKHLHLRLINPSFDCDIFKGIRLPALLSFRVNLYDSNAGWMTDMYRQLLSHSSNTLQRVEFWNFLLPGGFELGAQEGVTHSSLGGPHLVIPRIKQDLHSFFSILPMVQMLRLPIGLYIPETAMELIAQGELLPLLETLEIASCTGMDILTMVKERNEVAYRRGGFAGSSSAAMALDVCQHDVDCPAPPTFLSDVVIWTSMMQMQQVKSCVAFIQSLSSSHKTRLRILYVN